MSKPDVDVAIIGGGISGLAVANGLANTGLAVQLFEARPRLGGRIYSIPIAGGVAELGATWFWDNELRVQALIDELGLAVHDQWETGDSLVMSHRNVERYSRLWSTNSRRFSGGASQLIDGLAGRLPDGIVRLNSPVRRIEQTKNGVEVRLADETLHAGRVVVALPPSLAVSSGMVDGTNLEPEVRNVATQVAVWMGAMVKALAVYDEPFWRADGLSGSASSRQGPLHEIHDISGADGCPGILFGFAQSHPTGDLTRDVVIEQFSNLFGDRAAKPIDVIIQDWRRQQWTTPTEWPPSNSVNLFGAPALQRPTWNERLFWSSTETATISPGHIEGALAAAERTIAAITSF